MIGARESNRIRRLVPDGACRGSGDRAMFQEARADNRDKLLVRSLMADLRLK